ncbi:MAG TPA: neocarzinostatin apoprotein domain-containing protein [Acidimicrobiales bacterium]|jgi:hypothetical protein
MGELRSKKEILGVLAVVVAIATGATLPIVLSATAGAHSSPLAVATCSPPGITATTAPGKAPPVADSSPPCIPALSANPDVGLADGQTVTVTGTGFSADTTIGMVECQPGATGPGQCDLSTLLEVFSDGSGDFTTPYSVTRDITIPDPTNPNEATQIDCAKQECFLGAADVSDYSVAAATALSFNPALPLLLTGTMDHKGTVRPHTGVASISGTVTCAVPTTVDVEVDLTQFYKRFVFFNYADIIVQCTKSSKRWTVDVPPGNGLYGVGKAMADVYFATQFGNTYRQIEISGNVVLAKK